VCVGDRRKLSSAVILKAVGAGEGGEKRFRRSSVGRMSLKGGLKKTARGGAGEGEMPSGYNQDLNLIVGAGCSVRERQSEGLRERGFAQKLLLGSWENGGFRS